MYESNDISKIKTLILSIAVNTTNAYAIDDNRAMVLEEIFVTAQKRVQNPQNIPVALTVLNSEQINRLGISSLDLLDNIPSLRISPSGNNKGSLSLSIREGGTADFQPTVGHTVALYQDGIFLGRVQGLNNQLVDLERIEVLRGPQGTLYGRNSTSGAVNLVSKKPTGKWGVEQTISSGSSNYTRSVTRINTSKIAGVSTKFDYLHSEIDGWVENQAQGQFDYNESKKSGARLAVLWEPSERTSINYVYDNSEVKATQSYFQLYEDSIGLLGEERNRETKTRFQVALSPNIVDVEGHSVTTTVDISDSIIFKSYTSNRKLNEDGSTNWGHTFYAINAFGLILDEDIEQEQFSQEFQVLGGNGTELEWVAGLFYFTENVDFDQTAWISLTPSFDPIIPPLSIAPITPTVGGAESIAAYAQGTLNISDTLSLTTGLRYTTDEKTASRAGLKSPDIESDNWDYLLALNYDWTNQMGTYIKLASAYKAGGYNSRSATFLPFEEEENISLEVGLKADWFDRRLRTNAALFRSSIENKQFDFVNPIIPTLSETLNAEKEVDFSGFELEVSAIPFENFVAALSYTYLDGDMPIQPHPLTKEPTRFALINVPPHAGSLTLDYTLPESLFGTMHAHVDVTSTDHYAYSTQTNSRTDAYTLVNARLTLEHISLISEGNLSVSIWGRNLTDEEYVSAAFRIGEATTIQAFGQPRSGGIDIAYKF